MSVVVRMDMPEACADCPFMDDHLDHVSCLVTGSHEGYRFKHLINRMENCPIICSLPEGHGDLVDSEEDVSKYITIWDCNCSEFGRQTVMAVDDLQYLPIIVPADTAGKSET